MIQTPLITIFVPVYNGEKYLDETLLSIKRQTYTHFEVLLVDDSSTDNSRVLLDRYAEDSRFKVFQKKNGGTVAHSWNFIMPYMRGDYFFYSSQDDLFSQDLIEKMVLRQQETDADVILPDMEFYKENYPKNKQIVGLNGDRAIELSGKEACGESLNWNIHGFGLIKMDLVLGHPLPEDAFDSDEYITRVHFIKSNKVAFSQGMFYYRRDNKDAITKNFTLKNFYTLNTALRLFMLLRDNSGREKDLFIAQFSLLQKYSYLMSAFYTYKFESVEVKKEIVDFMSNFRRLHLTDSFYYHNYKYAFRHFKVKYILLICLIKIPGLFLVFKKYKKTAFKIREN